MLRENALYVRDATLRCPRQASSASAGATVQRAARVNTPGNTSPLAGEAGMLWESAAAAQKVLCRVGREVTHPGPSPDPD